jgi:F0F1-type ATP synthase assembly protein I
MITAIAITIFALILIFFDKFNDTTSNFLIWLYGIFAGTNIVEHITDGISKKDNQNN